MEAIRSIEAQASLHRVLSQNIVSESSPARLPETHFSTSANCATADALVKGFTISESQSTQNNTETLHFHQQII